MSKANKPLECEVHVGDVVEFLGNRGEVIERYTAANGTPRAKAEDVDGNTFDAPTRMLETLYCDVLPPSEIEVEVAPGVWVAEDLLGSSDEVEARNIWTAEEVA